MADDPLSVRVDGHGEMTAPGAAAKRSLAGRAGLYRLAPSPPQLIILERNPEGGEALPVATVSLAGAIDRVGGLTEIIHFISSSQWTGRFTVATDDGVAVARKSVFFRRGDVTAVSSNVVEDRIGAVLYRRGYVSAPELEHFLKQVTAEQRLGRVLVEAGKLTSHQLYQAVRTQIEEIFFSLLVLRRGEYYFHRSDEDANAPSHLQLPTQQLLFEGVRRIDEMAYFQEKLAGVDVVPHATMPRPPGSLPPRALRVLHLVDGRRPLSAIARESHLGEFEATKVLYQLLQTGWIEVRPRPGGAAAGSEPEAETFAETIAVFNELFARVQAAVAAGGRSDALRRGINSFLSSAGDFAPLFVELTLGDDGRLPAARLLANLERVVLEEPREYLRGGLHELLQYALFAAGEAVDRTEQAQMFRRLDEILAGSGAKAL